MKKAILLCLVCSFFYGAFAQSAASNFTVKWAPTGLVYGDINLQGEYNFGGKNSLTAKLGIPANAHHDFKYNDDDVNFNMKATSLMVGYRHYLSKKQMRGLYLEPYAKYVHHAADGLGNTTLDNQPVAMQFNNNYNGIGVGAQLGVQFFIAKRIAIDFYFLGPEINSSTDHFKTVEVTNTIPWNDIQANDAQKNIKDFVDQFPFIQNKTNINVDKNNRTVTADFKGALPGFRAGISLGVAF